MPEFDVQPASILELPPDTDFTQFDPKQPTQNHVGFKKSMETSLAAGLDVNYFSLTGDMEAVNYSSARVGLGEERDSWREMQDFVIDEFHREVFKAWLPNAMLTGAVDLTPREYMAVCDSSMWRPRGWRYVDPQKEIAATVVGIENKLLTWTDALAEQGVDLTEHLETLKFERELAEEYGVDLTIQSKTSVALAPKEEDDKPPAPEPDEPDDEDEGEDE
jgi:lambda family phage portal protein